MDKRDSNISIQHFTDFENIQEVWQSLLTKSCSDPFFMSFDWHSTWWSVFSPNQKLALIVLIVYENDQAIGIAPFFLEKISILGIPVNRLQITGNHWRAKGNIRSEYMDIICKQGSEKLVIDTIFNYLDTNFKWDEIVITNHWLESKTLPHIERNISERAAITRKFEENYTFYVNTQGDLDKFTKDLSPKTRSKVFNQRKKLAKHGEISIVYANKENVNYYLDQLNDFHQKRWGKLLFEGRRLEFHQNIAPILAEKSILDFSILCVNSQPISILYDFRVEDTKKGFQLGFDQSFDSKLSVGMLHFGYAIEKAFTTGITTYDFLRGMGKKGNTYKDSIAERYRQTATFQFIKSPLLVILYKTKGLFSGINK